jgi:RHH-type rel operon transcriptional repressor/antitoxin RelB
MSSAISIRLPEDVLREVDALAEMTDRSRTYIIKKAISEYLREYGDYLIALERLTDKDDRIISGKELRERLGQ